MTPGKESHGPRLWILCTAALLVVLDTTIVNVGLPAVREDLNISDARLVWVVSAYMLAFGGFLLVSGRLGDLYPRRGLLIAGIAAFTCASLVCSLATSSLVLIVARFIQGLGGAVVVATALALIVELFPDARDRAKAMSLYGFVSACGGGVGLLLGGLLTSTLSWRWIFLVNVPVGAILCVLAALLLPKRKPAAVDARINTCGALILTVALGTLIYVVARGNDLGWTSVATSVAFAFAIILLVVFVLVERRSARPFVPLAVLSAPNVAAANIVRAFWAGGAYAWFFISTLYLQGVLGLGPMQVGLAFLPSNLVMAAFAAGFSALSIARLGIKVSLILGLLIAAAGYASFARMPSDPRLVTDILPGMLLVGLGGGFAFGPVLIAAVDGVASESAGLASGLTNTSSMFGGALGLACMASFEQRRSDTLIAAGVSARDALAGGYHAAFIAASMCAIAAGVIALIFLKGLRRPRQPTVPLLPARDRVRIEVGEKPSSRRNARENWLADAKPVASATSRIEREVSRKSCRERPRRNAR